MWFLSDKESHQLVLYSITQANLFLFFVELMQNITIEERVAILEGQVMVIQDDVTGLDQDVNFLFDGNCHPRCQTFHSGTR